MKKQWIHHARKQDSYSYDWADKISVQSALRKYGIKFVFDEKMQVPNTARYRMPDLYSFNKQVAINLDGGWHGLEGNPTKYDEERDADFVQICKSYDCRYLVINSEESEGYDIELVRKAYCAFMKIAYEPDIQDKQHQSK